MNLLSISAATSLYRSNAVSQRTAGTMEVVPLPTPGGTESVQVQLSAAGRLKLATEQQATAAAASGAEQTNQARLEQARRTLHDEDTKASNAQLAAQRAFVFTGVAAYSRVFAS